MNIFYRWKSLLLKLYIAIVFITIAILEEPVLAIIPAIIIVTVLFLWWRPINPLINLMTDYLIFFTISILMAPHVGPFWSLLISLPALILVVNDLEVAAEITRPQDTKYPRYATVLGFTLSLTGVLSLVIALLIGNSSLIISSITAILFIAGLITLALRRIPGKPVEEIPVQQRIMAGTKATVLVSFNTRTRLGSMLFLKSPHEWLEINPEVLSLKEERVIAEVSLSPPLAGPAAIKIKACVLDRWGLTQTHFDMEPLQVYIIPRARYAAWLAKRYLSETQSGSLPLISNIGTLRLTYGLRVGVEYYGSQFYQPGDSLKNIDWKHSVKYDRLITKEFAEFRGQPAILLVNLSVSNAEEADKQTYNTIVAAMSLAREQIPTSIAAYDREEIKLVTPRLQPQALVSQALSVTDQITATGKPTRYLNPVDIIRLLSSLRRLQYVKSEASGALINILQIEYNNLKNIAQMNTASRALSLAYNKVGQQSSVVAVSLLNHDAEAIGFTAINCSNKGNPLLLI